MAKKITKPIEVSLVDPDDISRDAIKLVDKNYIKQYEQELAASEYKSASLIFSGILTYLEDKSFRHAYLAAAELAGRKPAKRLWDFMSNCSGLHDQPGLAGKIASWARHQSQVRFAASLLGKKASEWAIMNGVYPDFEHLCESITAKQLDDLYIMMQMNNLKVQKFEPMLLASALKQPEKLRKRHKSTDNQSENRYTTKVDNEIAEPTILNTKTERPAFPSRPVVNLERRAQKAAESHSMNPEKRYEKRLRSVRISVPVIEDKRVYLASCYSVDDDSDVPDCVCQMCQSRLSQVSFRLKNRQWYFESVEIFTREYLRRENNAAHLLLCPLCASKYVVVVKNDSVQLNSLRSWFLDTDLKTTNEEDLRFPLLFSDHAHYLQFVAAHFCDVQAVLRAEWKEKE